MKYLVFLFLLFPLSNYALYVGNPAQPRMPKDNLWLETTGAFSLKGSYDGDFVINRRIKTDSFANPGISSQMQGGEISFGILDRVEFYTTLGGFKTKITGRDFYLKTKESFGGEAGVRALAVFFGDKKIGLDGKYFYGWPDTPAKTSLQKEWQVAVSFGQTFAFLTPYVGAKCARFSLELIDLSPESGTIKIENVSPFGVFIGVGFAGKKGGFLNIEGRFLDETGWGVSAGIRF